MIEFTLPIALRTPNKTRGAHWNQKHRETIELELLICAVLAPKLRAAWNLIEAEEARKDRGGQWRLYQTRRRQRRRVSVTLVVPHARRLLKDDDNLRFTVKPLHDALVRLGLLKDDSRAYLERTEPTQTVSADGSECTIVRLEVLEWKES